MTDLDIGSRRGLSQISLPNATFAILALDHRNNLRTALDPRHPAFVSYHQLVRFKLDVVSALAPYASAVLLDPQLGAAQAVAQDSLPGSVGLLVAVEESGYLGDPALRSSRLLADWSVAKVRRMGASAVKLLVYYNPGAGNASAQEGLVSQVADQCARQDIPLVLEPLAYSLDPERRQLAPAERRQVIVETARRLCPLGAAVLKAQFPLDISSCPDETTWAAACAEVTTAAGIPWTLLSAGVDFETFLRQTRVACRSGASGVTAGRAVWKEAVDLQGDERIRFLQTTGIARMKKLSQVCELYGTPWTAAYPPHVIQPGWHETYGDIRGQSKKVNDSH